MSRQVDGLLRSMAWIRFFTAWIGSLCWKQIFKTSTGKQFRKQQKLLQTASSTVCPQMTAASIAYAACTAGLRLSGERPPSTQMGGHFYDVFYNSNLRWLAFENTESLAWEKSRWTSNFELIVSNAGLYLRNQQGSKIHSIADMTCKHRWQTSLQIWLPHTT